MLRNRSEMADAPETIMESWDCRYAQGKYTSSMPNGLLVGLTGKLIAGTALDLACGAGRHAIFLAEKGWRVTAVDASAAGVEIARAKAAEKNLKIDFRVADLESGGFQIDEEAYDLICDFYYLQRNLFERIKLGVRPGGTVVSAIHLFDESRKDSRYTLNEGELLTFFKGFEILHYREAASAPRHAGEGHRTTAEIIARRKN